jgi:hypothetical protein
MSIRKRVVRMILRREGGVTGWLMVKYAGWGGMGSSKVNVSWAGVNSGSSATSKFHCFSENSIVGQPLEGCITIWACGVSGGDARFWSSIVVKPPVPALKTKFIPPSGEAVDLVSLLTRVVSLSRGDIGVGGARLLFRDDPAVRDGGSRMVW